MSRVTTAVPAEPEKPQICSMIFSLSDGNLISYSDLDEHHTAQYIRIDDYLLRVRLSKRKPQYIFEDTTLHTIHIDFVFLHKVSKTLQTLRRAYSLHIDVEVSDCGNRSPSDSKSLPHCYTRNIESITA